MPPGSPRPGRWPGEAGSGSAISRPSRHPLHRRHAPPAAPSLAATPLHLADGRGYCGPIPPVEGLAGLGAHGADCGHFAARAMMTMPARRARWAGCGGSSAPQARQGIGRNGVHRRLASFACHPTELPPPGCAHLTPTGIAASRSKPGTRRRSFKGVPLAEPVNAPAAPTQPVDVEALHSLVMQSLDDDQAVEVVTIPLAGKSSIADHMVIASGRSSRQVASMANKLAEKIKQQFGRIGADRGPAGRRLGADRRRRRDRPSVPARSAHLLQSRADVGVRRRRRRPKPPPRPAH